MVIEAKWDSFNEREFISILEERIKEYRVFSVKLVRPLIKLTKRFSKRS